MHGDTLQKKRTYAYLILLIIKIGFENSAKKSLSKGQESVIPLE